MSVFWQRLRNGRWLLAGLLAVGAFAVLAGRFWHPYYGFTKFVQLDEADARSGIPEIREHPVFVYPGFNGYDGAAYTQIAFHPLLDSPDLARAVGNVPYRARRILGSAVAWLVSAGQPARIATVYAGLNLAVWVALAVLLWRALPVTNAQSYVAWIGVMFSAGALHSVRLALTDLLAATLVAAAISAGEAERRKAALGWLAAAGLARETALAAVVGLWRGPWTSRSAWLGNLIRAGLVSVPLAAWIGYVRWKAGPADQGFGNFTWPVAGWLAKWSDTIADYVRHPDFRWLNTTTLLAVVGLTVQAAYFLRRPRLDNPWWRVGLAGVAMLAMLGTSVWEGHPGAATRVLLPMTVAFAVVAVRERAGWAWLTAGALTAASGVMALRHVPEDPREIAAGRARGGAYVVRLDGGWYGVERDGNKAWAWAARDGRLRVDVAPRDTTTVSVRLRVRAMSPRELEVGARAGVLWKGSVTSRLEWIEVPRVPLERGRADLTLHSATAPEQENTHPDARALGFALYGVEVK